MHALLPIGGQSNSFIATQLIQAEAEAHTLQLKINLKLEVRCEGHSSICQAHARLGSRSIVPLAS